MTAITHKTNRPDPAARLAWACWVGLFSIVLAGCGTGEYDKRMKVRLAELQRESSFVAYLYKQQTPVPGTGVSFRLPKEFTAKARKLRGGDANDPFTKLPGFRFGFAQLIHDKYAKRMPILCYVCVLDASSAGREEVMAQALKVLGDVAAETPPQWSDVSLPTPGGKTIACKTTSAAGQQTFDLTAKGGIVGKLPGQAALYLHTSKDYHVLLGWRAPTSLLATGVPLFKAAAATMGTLEIGPPPEKGKN